MTDGEISEPKKDKSLRGFKLFAIGVTIVGLTSIAGLIMITDSAKREKEHQMETRQKISAIEDMGEGGVHGHNIEGIAVFMKDDDQTIRVLASHAVKKRSAHGQDLSPIFFDIRDRLRFENGRSESERRNLVMAIKHQIDAGLSSDFTSNYISILAREMARDMRGEDDFYYKEMLADTLAKNVCLKGWLLFDDMRFIVQERDRIIKIEETSNIYNPARDLYKRGLNDIISCDFENLRKIERNEQNGKFEKEGSLRHKADESRRLARITERRINDRNFHMRAQSKNRAIIRKR